MRSCQSGTSTTKNYGKVAYSDDIDAQSVGWIALALVVFASWRPGRVLVGAYLFGAVTFAQFHAQAWGLGIPAQFLSSLPYVATIVVLVIIARNRRLTMINTPASLGLPFVPDR